MSGTKTQNFIWREMKQVAGESRDDRLPATTIPAFLVFVTSFPRNRIEDQLLRLSRLTTLFHLACIVERKREFVCVCMQALHATLLTI